MVFGDDGVELLRWSDNVDKVQVVLAMTNFPWLISQEIGKFALGLSKGLRSRLPHKRAKFKVSAIRRLARFLR